VRDGRARSDGGVLEAGLAHAGGAVYARAGESGTRARDPGANYFDRHDTTRAAARLTKGLEALGFTVALSTA
jgi:hypothetical protein